MWPRTPAEHEMARRTGCLTGFVCFMDRDSADRALRNLNHHLLLGLPLQLGWGKAVPLPPVPLFGKYFTDLRRVKECVIEGKGREREGKSSKCHSHPSFHHVYFLIKSIQCGKRRWKGGDKGEASILIFHGMRRMWKRKRIIWQREGVRMVMLP